jgi:hypothetical protein
MLPEFDKGILRDIICEIVAPKFKVQVIAQRIEIFLKNCVKTISVQMPCFSGSSMSCSVLSVGEITKKLIFWVG